jgi:hypothetical protein
MSIKELALSVPGYSNIQAPKEIPSGGLPRLISSGGNAMAIVIGFAVILTLVMLLWGAILWITSEGDKQKLAAARSRLIYAIIGLVLVFLSFAIVGLVGNVFGVKLLGK